MSRVVHKFVRNQNINSGYYFRPANRHDPFKNTLTLLNDPATGRQLYLIGTTNSSTLLANRTKKLIENEKPDSVFVQTNKEWYDLVSNIKGIQSQADLNEYNSLLSNAYNFQIENNPRGLIFKYKLYGWLYIANWIKGFGGDFHPFIPGLEMKYAIDSAKKLNVPVILGGLAIDDIALNALQVESRLDPFVLFYNYSVSKHNSLWKREFSDLNASLDVHGGEAFAESVDRSRANWFVKFFEKFAPYQKQILVDQKDLDIFYALYRNTKSKKTVAIVNQWHVSGIEAHWRAATGTQLKEEPINPVGDFDIDQLQEGKLLNDELRLFTSKLGRTEPATWKDYGTQYHQDNFEAERVRHVEFQSHDDPHMYHGLPYGGHGHGDDAHGHHDHGHHDTHAKVAHEEHAPKDQKAANPKKH